MFKVLKLASWLFLLFSIPSPVLASGSKLYGRTLAEIRITGARFTDRKIIVRELASRIGKPYLRKNAAKDFARLDKLDIFSYVKVQPVEEAGAVVLEVEVKEIFPYLPFFSYEVTDENGFSGGPGFQSVNMLRRDISVFASARFGGEKNINVLFDNPWISGNHLSLRFEFFQRDRFNELDQFNETATETYLQIGSYLGEYGRIGGRFSFISIGSDSAGRTLSPESRDNLSSLGFFVGYDSRDLWSNPHRGWWSEIEVSKNGGFLGSDGDFWTFNIDVRRYLPIINKHTLALFSLTTLRTGTLGQDIAIHQDFHLGGTNSIRGWDLDSRRGKNQFINTAEYNITLVEPKVLSLLGLSADVGLQVAAFGDLGIAWPNSDEFETDRFIGGYGFGVRFLVPFVNQFRIDFAYGQQGRRLKLHLGAFEKPVAQRLRVR